VRRPRAGYRRRRGMRCDALPAGLVGAAAPARRTAPVGATGCCPTLRALGAPQQGAKREPLTRRAARAAAIVSLFNVSDDFADNELALRLRNEYGEVRRVWPHPGLRGCRLVEFFDLRVAAAVVAALEGAGSKVPTISEARIHSLPCLPVPASPAAPAG